MPGSKPGERRGGRQAGTGNKDKSELRSIVQDAVHKHTIMLQERLIRDLREQNPDWSLEQARARAEELQPIIEEYDPVAELAMMAADRSNKPDLRRQAHSDASQYLRPKLKTIEHIDDPLTREAEKERFSLAERLGQLLVGAGAGQSTARPAATPPDPSAQPDDEDF